MKQHTVHNPVLWIREIIGAKELYFSRLRETGNRPCGSQCRDLRLDALAVCGYSRIAVDHAPIMHISFAQRKPHGISELFFVRNS